MSRLPRRRTWMLLVLSFLVLPVVSACSSQSAVPTGLLPEIKSFVSTHPEYGKPTGTQEVPDWAKGPRQRVTFDSGRDLLFYVKDGSVLAVYEDGPNGRQKVWGEYDTGS